MDPPQGKRRNFYHGKQRKADTKKIVDKITYSPQKHKQKVTRALRQKLQNRKTPTTTTAPPPPPKLKFGSFNVNGLDTEAAWAIDQLLKKRNFDVSINIRNI